MHFFGRGDIALPGGLFCGETSEAHSYLSYLNRGNPPSFFSLSVPLPIDAFVLGLSCTSPVLILHLLCASTYPKIDASVI